MLCIKYHSFQSNVPCIAGYKEIFTLLTVNQCECYSKCLSYLQEICYAIARIITDNL